MYNVKALLIDPQKIAFDYIAGRRKGILNPISFLVLSITLYIIVISLFKAPQERSPDKPLSKSELQAAANFVGLFLRTYLKFFWILCIIPLGLSLKLFFRQYNFIEHLAISSFIIAQATLIGVFSFLFLRFPLIFDPVVYLSILWLVYRMFNKQDKTKAAAISISTLILFGFQLMLIIGILAAIKYNYF